ncbi:hypothetical protein LAZ67_2005084 [Cordylochernes scorpioides]|uniref:Reverse transcriptase domain-containing protein n=1 Tax=Cordylochernes scorpioides TaxID=51811 RepID=A0ABY6K7G2_9ARAC|nr:hypothetical protein LAZ67_2005084 [Cordylochernes scorpioides]
MDMESPRCPSWNIACVSDEVAQAFKNKTPLAVISTDLQSAFDNVDREFLASQLRIIGLPPPFMEWLHLLYAEADATIKVDGNFTRPFKMRRGLRQGCACSAALFSIFTGPLLRHLERILGRGNVLAYADDILLLIREDWQFERVKTIFDEFRRASGVSVNFPKSKGLWCGAWRDRADSPLGISWSASSITERSISRWSPFVRGFSLVGRARAANSLVLAAVLHHLHGYLPGDATIAKLQARLTRFVWGSCHRAAWLPGGLLARPVSVGGVGLLDIRTQLQLACFKGVQAASRNGGKNAYSWLVESGAWMTPLSSGSWLLPRLRRLLDLWGQASSILGLNHRVLPAPTLLNLPLVGACRFLATPSLRAPSRWRGVRVRDLAGPAPPPIARLTRSACEDAAALGAFCQRLVADNATSVYRERTLEEAVVLCGTATPFLRISTRTARRMLERPRLAAVPISRYLRRWAPFVDVPSTSLAFSSLRRCSFGGHAADIALRLALHALPHPGHPASSQPVCIACGSSDLSLAHRYWSCSAVRPLIREVFSIIGRPPDLQSWIFAVNLENHAITISSAAKHAIYVFFVDREMRGISGDPSAIFHQTLQRWQRRHLCIHIEGLPTRLNITIKGEAWPAYLSSGIRCSRCRGQGHRRANCPLLAGRTNAPGPATPTSPTSVPPVTAPGLPQQPSAHPTPPASSSPAMEIPSASPAARAVTPSAAPRPSTPVAPAVPVEMAPPAPPPVTPAPSLRAPGGSVSPQSTKSGPPAQDIEMTAIEESSASSTSSSRTSMRDDLVAFIQRSPTVSFTGTDALGLGREEVLDLLSSRTKAQRKRGLLTPPQTDALAGLIEQILGLKPAGNTNVYKILHQVKSELKKGPAAVPPTPPLPAPRPAGPTPPVPHGVETKPAMATPPPPLPTPMEEEHVDHEDLMEDLFDELNSDTELKPLLDSGFSTYDLIEAILHRNERALLIAQLSPSQKIIFAGFIDIVIWRAQHCDNHIRQRLANFRKALNS